METRRRTILRLTYRCHKCRDGAIKCKVLALLALIFLGPITEAVGQQQPQSRNTLGPFKSASLAQESIVSIEPLWGGSISQFNSSPVRLQQTVLLHHFDLPCKTCHGTAEVTSAGKIQRGNTGQKRIDINRTCTLSGCHDYDTVLNHPVGVSVNSMIPEDMPLDGLRITCLTCHNQPKLSSVAAETDGAKERRLRVPNGVDFCGSCHMKMAGSLQKRSHWQFSSRAHLGQINLRSGLNRNPVRSIGRIDNESRTCISCHQDITVTIPGYNETSSQKRDRWRKMTNHPIGMEYSRVAMRKAPRYRYPLMNSYRIRLFDGKVGCGSCHSLYSGRKGQLVQSNLRSALCLECHNS